jgi:hypothetical protein
VKTYRATPEVHAQIEKVLSRRPAASFSPLDEVAEILSDGRHYAWIGIYLVAGERSAPAQTPATAVAESQSRSVIPIRLGQHQFGVIEVQGESGRAVAGEDRVLLKRVAGRLAKYLHGPGAYLARKAREAAAEQPHPVEARHQPASEKPQVRTLAAAGEGRR